jgi:gas vesicle protein
MAEVEFGGLKFTGGKMFALLTALSTLGGAAWGGFEVYKDYMDMKEIIANIDTDAIAARNDVIETKLDEAIEYTRDIKKDLKDDILRIEQINDNTTRRVKEIQTDVDNRIRNMEDLNRETEKDVRDVTSTLDKDVRQTMRETEERIEDDMAKLESDLNKRIQEALDNPLAN